MWQCEVAPGKFSEVEPKTATKFDFQGGCFFFSLHAHIERDRKVYKMFMDLLSALVFIISILYLTIEIYCLELSRYPEFNAYFL